MSDDSLCKILLEGDWSAMKKVIALKFIQTEKNNLDFINGHTKTNQLTPLMIASREGMIDIVSQLLLSLLEHKCDINQTDKRGNTALMHAAWEVMVQL